MAETKKSESKSRPGRQAPARKDPRQFLAVMEAQTIKDLKAAAAQQDRSASQVLEEAANEWLKRYRAAERGKKR
jgi:hypothetical protein